MSAWDLAKVGLGPLHDGCGYKHLYHWTAADLLALDMWSEGKAALCGSFLASYTPCIMKVDGQHLERARSLVLELQALECSEHDDLADVYLIVSQDGSLQMPDFGIHCCDSFRATAKQAIETHNEAVRRLHTS